MRSPFLRLLLPFTLLVFVSIPVSSSSPKKSGQPAAIGEQKKVPIVLERLEATVNGTTLLKSDIESFRKSWGLRQQLDPLFSGTPLANQGPQAPSNAIVEYLIDESIILGAFPVADPEVETEINTIQSNNRMDRASLKAALGAQGYEFKDYQELIRVGVAKRNLIDREIRTKVNITDDDVKNHFYNNYAKSSKAPRSFQVRILTVSTENYKNAAAAKEVIERARKQILGGEPFEDVAKTMSDDPSAAQGGDLGRLTEDQMSPQIKDALKKLKIGECSQVLGDPKSRFFLLKLVDISSAESDQLKQVKEEIRGQLAASEYQRQIELWLGRQRQSASIHLPGNAKNDEERKL